MKKTTSIILTLVMAISIFGANIIDPIKTQAATTIKIGDYVQMGKYYDEPILWRCVDIDATNGPLMLADKILTIKAFDANGTHKYLDGTTQADNPNGSRTSLGSNLWETSNMRSWLNSTSTAGNVTWLDGCPPTDANVSYGYAYDTEKGFMADGNFTASERNIIKTVTQGTLLNGVDTTKLENSSISCADSDNYSYRGKGRGVGYFASYQYVTEKMFLLDENQKNRVRQNGTTLGTSYYIGQPTQKAVDNSAYKGTSLATGKNWCSWLRTPLGDSGYPYLVRTVQSDGSVNNNDATFAYNVGVRPAFYINLSSESFKSGTDGSVSNPYKFISTACEVVTSTIPENATIGTNTITASVINTITSITVDVAPSANATWKLYSDASCTTYITNKIMPLVVGVNTAYVKVTAEDGTTNKIYTVTVIKDAAMKDTLNIGDYVQMGTYYDEPILWRCVDIDVTNGPLMLADKILTIKPFDGIGYHKYIDGTTQADTAGTDQDYINGYRTSLGSNLWETSNMRSWLNSTATAGNVTWLDGCPPVEANGEGCNSYVAEKGFMADGNFTASERNVIKSVTQKSLLNDVDIKKLKVGGTAIHTNDSSISSIVQNYDTAYYQNVTDKMFLLDVKQINKVYQNRIKLGATYYIGQLTQEAVDNSAYVDGNVTAGKNYISWLRSPCPGSSVPSGVRSVYSDGGVSYSSAVFPGYGVRPAFYINLSFESFKSGTDGSLANPYKFPSITDCGVVTSKTPVNTPVNVTVLPNGTYSNGDTLTVTSATQGTYGSTSVNLDGTIKYTPNYGYLGTDTFTYTISDRNGATATATVTVIISPRYKIGNKVWLDTNKNGIFDNGEAGLPNVIVNLYDENNLSYNVTTTDNNGEYVFENVEPASYSVQFSLSNYSSFYEFTTQGNGANVYNDSKADRVTGQTLMFNLSSDNNTIDAGVITVLTPTPVPIPAKKPVRLNFNCAYLYGYEMGGVGAEDTIKREEASALLYRLLKQNNKLDGFVKPVNATFSDVATNRWSFSAVEYMASIDVFDKISGKVRPGAEITRGEASKIIAYSMGMQPDDSKTNSFTDLTTDNKYYNPIKALVDAGILKGYTDNTIKPNGLLTRAEYVTMINRLIGRDSSYAVDSETNPYPDMSNSHWAYKEIMRASFGFSDDDTGKLKIDPAKKLKRSEIDYN